MTNYENILKDETFQAKIQEATNLEQVAKILNEYGIPATEEALKAAQENVEMTDSDLDQVAGGIVRLNPFYWLAKWYVEKMMGKYGLC